MEFVIPGELPDLNQIIKASKSHYMAYSTMKKKNTELVMWSSKGLPKIDHADFEITWYCKNKHKDKDNITAGIKFILDGLVENGILPNDGWKEVGDIKHILKVDKNNPRIEVKLWPTQKSKNNT